MKPHPHPRLKIAFTLAALLAGLVAPAHAVTRYVSTYGATPNDGLDDTTAINNAITACASGDVLVFGAGTYDLITPFDTVRFIKISGKTGVTLQGAVSGTTPATKLLRHVTVQNMASPPRTIYLLNSTGITLKNFVVDNTPHLATSGEVTEIDPAGKYVRVKIFGGLPMVDGSACYAANAWEPAVKQLKKVASLTFNSSPANWTIHNATNRVMQLTKSTGLGFLGSLAVGDRMSWHYGYDGYSQIEVGTSTNIAIDNILVRNAINIAFLIGSTNGVALSKIRLEPEGKQLPVGPRDGIHLSRCTGVVTCEELNITGVRMDGLVVRTPYAAISEVTNSTHFNIAVEISTFNQPIATGSKLHLFDSSGNVSSLTVGSATWLNDTGGKGNYSIVTSTALPSGAGVGTALICSSLSPTSTTIHNSSFTNIAGSAVMAMSGDLTIDGITASHVMYPAVHIGDNVGSGGCSRNVVVRDSIFDSCSWRPKLETNFPGVITMANVHATHTAARNHNVTIHNNTFRNHLFDSAFPAINVSDTKTVALTDNVFENTHRGILIDTATVTGLTATGSDVIIDNTNNTQTYAELVGTFLDSSLNGYNGTKSRYSASPGAKARWTFVAPRTGTYAVHIYKVVNSGSDTNAKITVTHNGGASVSYQNYATGGSDWVSLGNFSFTEGATYTITNERSAGYLRADAVLFQQL